MYFVFFKIFNFNSSQMKYFSCQIHFCLLFFLVENSFALTSLASVNFAPFAKCLSWDVAKGTAGKHFFFCSSLDFSFFFSFTKSEINLENISSLFSYSYSFFLIYLLSNIFVSYFWCCCLALLVFLAIHNSISHIFCMLNSLFCVWWKYDLWHSGLYLGLFSVGILFRGGKWKTLKDNFI